MSQNIKWSSVVKQAQKDVEFRTFLLEDPKAAIEQVTDIQLPDDVEFFVHEQSLKQVHLLLPFEQASYASSNGDGDDKAVFVEPDDKSGDKAVFVEPDDKSGDKAVFVEPDDKSDDKAVFVEPDDTNN